MVPIMVRCPRCDWQETIAGAPPRPSCPKCGLPLAARAQQNRTVLDYAPGSPAASQQQNFAATMPIGTQRMTPIAPPPDDPDAEQDTTLIKDVPDSSPSPFPNFGSSLNDEENTRLGEVPPEVLAQLARNRGSDRPPRPQPVAPVQPVAPAQPATPPAPRAVKTMFEQAPAEEDTPFEDDDPTYLADAPIEARNFRTQLGVPRIAAPAAPPLVAPPRPGMKTQLGVPGIGGPASIPAPPAPLSTAPPPPLDAPAPELQPAPDRPGTLFGLQAEASRAASSAPPIQPSAAPQPLAPGQPAPRRVPNASPTLLGGVLASAASAANAAHAPPAPPAPFPQPGGYPGGAQPMNPPMGQMPQAMGAPPPMGPMGQTQVPPTLTSGAQPPQQPAFGQAGVAVAEPPRKRSGVPLLLVLLVLAAVIGVGGFVGWKWSRGQDLSPTASIDASGKDLELSCASCPDGTLVSLGGSFSGGKARAILTAPLEVGDQVLDVVIQAPGAKAQAFKVPVAVELRLDLDTSTLHAFPPALTLRAQVRPGGTLTFDGKPAGDSLVVPVGEIAEGVNAAVAKSKLRVAYHYEREGISPRDGVIEQELAVLPLRIFTPKDGAFTSAATVTLQGQAPPGIEVHIGDKVQKPDDKGLFQQEIPLEIGANTIKVWLARAESGYGGVSRGVTLDVTRTAAANALYNDAKKKVESGTPGNLNALYTDPAGQIGREFVFAGEVVEAQSQRGELVALIDGSPNAAGVTAKSPLACTASSCLLRVVAGDVRFGRGEKIRGVGRSVTPRDAKTPELEAYVLEKR